MYEEKASDSSSPSPLQLADPKLLGSKGKKWQQAKAIIDRWTVLFDKNDI
jgi:hypothetical protein